MTAGRGRSMWVPTTNFTKTHSSTELKTKPKPTHTPLDGPLFSARPRTLASVKPSSTPRPTKSRTTIPQRDQIIMHSRSHSHEIDTDGEDYPYRTELLGANWPSRC